MKFGYTLSSEEFGPLELAKNAQLAEVAGFDFVMISDHYHPWVDKQGQSPFVWNVIGALSQVTKKVLVGTGVTCPIIRIHPAIIAQAAATSQVMLEGRFMLGLGTGENLNEHVVGQGWPSYHQRSEMMIEAIQILRLLWQGGYQSFYGKYFTVDNAKIYTLPSQLIPLLMAGYGAQSIALAGRYTDGFICTRPDKKLVQRFRKYAGKRKSTYAQMNVCYDSNEDRAKKILLQEWPIAAMPHPLHSEINHPAAEPTGYGLRHEPKF